MKMIVTIIAIVMTIETLAGKSLASSWPYRAFSPCFNDSSCKCKMILSMAVRGEEEKNPYGHHPLTIIFLSAGGTVKTDIKLSELPSFIILLVINVKATMKVSLLLGSSCCLFIYFSCGWRLLQGGFPHCHPHRTWLLLTNIGKKGAESLNMETRCGFCFLK